MKSILGCNVLKASKGEVKEGGSENATSASNCEHPRPIRASSFVWVVV